MKAQLKSITLENFRGISKTFEFGPGRNVYAGPNGSGKTTLPEAERFVRDGNINFEVKSIVDGQKQQKGEHTVKAVYAVNGQDVELGRTYYEKWTKKRGALEETKSGNESRYFVDGLEIEKRKDYTAKLLELFGPDYDKCTDINFLPSMHWKELRTLLSKLAPVDRDKVIDSVSGLRGFLDVKGAGTVRTIDEAKTAADQRKKKIAEQIANIPAQIQEHQSILDSAGGISEEKAQAEIDAAQKAIDDTKAKIAAINQGDDSVEKLRKLNDDLIKAESDFQDKQSEAREKENQRQTDIKNADFALKNLSEDLKDHEEAKQKAAAEYWDVHNSTPEDETVCDKCGQDLPEEKVADLQENFNLNKARKLEEIKARGGDLKKEIARIQEQIDAKEKEKAELEAVKPDPILKESTTEEIDGIKHAIAIIKNLTELAKKEIPAELTATLEASEKRLEYAREIKAQIKAVAGSQQRIEELTAKKAELSAENDRVEKFLSLYQQYNKELADATEGPVNELFSVVNFRMFKELEGGGIVEACEIFDKKWRPYHGALSNGEQVRAGVDMVSTLQKALGVSGCVFLDNFESVTTGIELDCQYVELVATEEYESLTKAV